MSDNTKGENSEIEIDEIAAEMRDEILAIVDEQNAIIASLNDDKLCHLTIGQAAITAFTDALPKDKARLNELLRKRRKQPIICSLTSRAPIT